MSESKKSRYNDENDPSSVGNSASDSDVGETAGEIRNGENGGNGGGGESSSAESCSESDSDFDEADVDGRRRVCVRKMLELEKQFVEIKENLYSGKMQNFELQLSQVKDEIAPEYNKRLAALRESFRSGDKILDILKDFQLNELKILFENETVAAHLDYENDKRILFDRLKSEVEANIVELQYEKRNADLNFELWQRENRRSSTSAALNSSSVCCNQQQQRISPDFETTANSSSTDRIAGSKRAATPPSGGTEKRRKALAVSGPYIVYMLKSSEIQDDWNIIQRAIMQAELRDMTYN